MASVAGGFYAGVGAAAGASVAVNEIANQTTATIDASTLTGPSTGALNVTADSQAFIDALAVTISGALGVGIGGVGLSGFGAAAKNAVHNLTEASIAGSSTTAAASITVGAADDASITADTYGLSVSGGVGIVAGSLSFGASLSLNEVGNLTRALIGDSSVISNAGVTVSAISAANIDASAVGIALGGAAAGVSLNVVASASVANNDIGSQTRAIIDDSRVNAGGAVDVTAASTGNINASAVGVVVSGNYGGVTLNISGVAGITTNTVASTTEALIQNNDSASGRGVFADGRVRVQADDSSSISADAVAGGVSVSGNAAGFSATGSASVATNAISNTLRAGIDGSEVQAAAGDVEVLAHSDSNIDSAAAAAAIDVQVSGLLFSVNAAGAGANAVNTIGNLVEASIRGGSTVTASQHVTVEAADTSGVEAVVVGTATQVGFIGAAVGVSLTSNTIDNIILAYADGSALDAQGGDIQIGAVATQTTHATSVAAALAAGISGAVSGADASSRIDGEVEAYGNGGSLTSSGNTRITASSDLSAEASTSAASASGLGISVMTPEVVIGGATRAYAQGAMTVSAANFAVQASSVNDAILPDNLALAIGVGGFAGAGASATVSRLTEAYAGTAVGAAPASGTDINAGNGDVSIEATATSTATSKETGGAFGGIAIGAFLSDATIDGATRAYVGQAATVRAGALDIHATATETATAHVAPIGAGIIDGTGANSSATIASVTEAFVGTQSGGTSGLLGTTLAVSGATAITAKSIGIADGRTDGGSGGGLSITALLSSATNDAVTRAYIGAKTAVSAGSLNLEADGSQSTEAETFVVSVGAITGSGASTDSRIGGSVESWIGAPVGQSLNSPGTQVDVSGAVVVRANSNAYAQTDASGGTGNVIGGVQAMLPKATVATQTAASVGSGVSLQAASLDIKATVERRKAEATDNFIGISLVADGTGTSADAHISGAVQAVLGGSATTIAVDGALDVVAETADGTAVARTRLGGGSTLDVKVALAEASNTASTQAWIADGTQITGAGSVTVKADSKDTAYATSDVASGGLISGRGTTAETTVAPSTQAWVGRGVRLDTRGALSVDAIAQTAEGDASATAVGGGGIDIGVSTATLTVRPTVQAWIGGDSTRVDAGGNVTVNAELRQQQEQGGVSFDDNLAHNGVSIANDTISFSRHGLATGDVVTYDANGQDEIGTASGPLAGGRDYGVIVVDADTLALGAAANGTAVDTGSPFPLDAGISGIDTNRDVIVFGGPHNLVTGDRIIYNGGGAAGNILPPGSYLVRVIDDRTIKLDTALSDPVSFDATQGGLISGGNRLNLAGFDNGDLVTYRAPATAGFSSAAVDQAGPDGEGEFTPSDNNEIYIKNRIDTDGDGAPDIDVGHGLADGQIVTYRTNGNVIGGLADGASYKVVRIDDFRIKLAGTTESTVAGLVFASVANAADTITRTAASGSWIADGFTAGQPIVISGTGSNDGERTILSVTDTQLTFAGDVLTNEDVAGNTTLRSAEILLDPSTSPSTVRHLLVPQALGGLEDGLNYTVVNSSGGSFQLQAPNGVVVPTLSVGNALGTHQLGKEGLALNASGGTALNHEFRLDITSTRPGQVNLLLGPGGVSLRQVSPATGDGTSSASARGAGGGALSVGVPTATVAFVADVQASIDADRVRSGGDVAITSVSAASVSAFGSSRNGGFIQVGDTDANVNYDTRNNAYVGHAAPGVSVRNIVDEGANPQVNASGVNIEAAGDFRMHAITDVTAGSTASGKGGGFISVSNATAENDVTASTNAIFGSGATVDARTVDALAQARSIRPTATSEATAGGFAGGATAKADNDITSSTLVLLEGTAPGLTTITGREGMDMEATHTTVNAVRRPDGRWYGLFGGSSEPGDNSGNVRNLIDGDTGVVVTVAPRPGSATSSALPPSPLDAVGGFNSLALLGKANNGSILALTNGEADGEIKQDRRAVRWDADIVVGAGPAPDLYVNADGTIRRAINVSVNGTPHPAPDTQTGAQVEVGDIANARLGEVVFQALGDIVGGRQIGSHYWGTFTFANGFDTVRITNASDKPLFINDIDLISAAGTPRVHLDKGGEAVGLNFKLEQTYAPAVIDIRNLGSGDITLRYGKSINNPVGETRILNTGGSILAEGGTNPNGSYLIRTGTLGNEFTSTVTADFEGETQRRLEGVIGFATNGAAPDTLTRQDGGSWVADGFIVGDLVKLEVAGQTPYVVQIAAFTGGNQQTAVLNTLEAVLPQSAEALVSRFHGIDAKGSVGSAAAPVRVELINAPTQVRAGLGRGGDRPLPRFQHTFPRLHCRRQRRAADRHAAHRHRRPPVADTQVRLGQSVIEAAVRPANGVLVTVQGRATARAAPITTSTAKTRWMPRATRSVCFTRRRRSPLAPPPRWTPPGPSVWPRPAITCASTPSTAPTRTPTRAWSTSWARATSAPVAASSTS